MKTIKETADKVCKLLESYGVKCTLDERIDRPEKILRGSWYVEKLVDLGFNECMHIDVKKDENTLGFFAILDEGRIMSGSNMMITNTFITLGEELGIDHDEVIDTINYGEYYELYVRDDWGEDGCVICNTYEAFEGLLEQAENITKAIAHIRRNVDMNEVGLAIRKMDERREPLFRVNHRLSDAIYDLMEEYGEDNDLPEGWWLDEFDEEEILFRL